MDRLGVSFLRQPIGVGIGDWLRSERTNAALSQAAVAAKAGLSKPTVIQLERGRGNIRSLTAFLGALGCEARLNLQSTKPPPARILLGDCLTLLPTIPDGSVDAVIADLPYGMSKLEWDRPIPLDRLWEEFRRILRPTGAVVLTASQPFTAELIVSNREWFKYSLVWEKSRATGFLQAKQMPLRAHEDICVFSPGVLIGRHRSRRQMTYNPQGIAAVTEDDNARRQQSGESKFLGGTVRNERRPTHTGYPTSIIRVPSEPRPEHPTQKPLELMQHLVRTYTNAGDTIVDCCMGSGSTGVAAAHEGRAFIGIEQDPNYFEIARRRFAAAGVATMIECGQQP
jgi:DNA modification methylase